MARILIVEDDPLVALGFKLFLESRNHEVLAIAVNGPQAVAETLSRQPDLVLMDVRLRGEMDGIEAARRILAERRQSILFVSGSGEPLTLERIRALNPAGVLLKPVAPNDLAAEVERLTKERV